MLTPYSRSRAAGALAVLLLSVAAFAAAQAPAAGGPTTPAANATGLIQAIATLPAFTAVRSCLPFNILILPNLAAANTTATDNTTATSTTPTPGSAAPAPGNATLSFIAEPDVINATDISLSPNGILTLSVLRGYETRRIINLTITTASPSDLRYVQNFGSGDLVVGPGFDVPDFSAAITAIGTILAYNLTAPKVYVTNSGIGTVLLNGTFGGADISNTGTGRIYLAGPTNGTVSVRAGGISTTWLQTTSSAQILGTADGLAKVLYTGGSCNVQPTFKSLFGINIFGDACQNVGLATLPRFTPLWTCGILVDGTSNCRVTFAVPRSSQPVATGLGLSATPTTTPNTIVTPAGTVTTSTSTTPGGASYASGTVGGSAAPPVTQTETSQGGAPPSVTTSNPVGASILGIDIGPPSISPGISSASSVSVGGQPTVSSTSVPIGLGIPTTTSGLAVVTVQCQDPQQTMFAPSA